MRLRPVLGNERIRSILSNVEALPSLPGVYESLEAELRKEAPSLQYIGDLIEQDMGLTTSLLKVVNSSFFGLRRHVSSPHQAVVLLGTETVKSLILVIDLGKRFVIKTSADYDVSLLWQHCTFTGHLARCIAAHNKADKDTVDHSFIAGLLHDVGKLVLLTRLESDYKTVLGLVSADGLSINDAEQQVLGTTHAEMGAYLLALWGLPTPVVEAVLLHHRPEVQDPVRFTPLAAVHIANALERQIHVVHEAFLQPELDMGYLQAMGLEGELDDIQGLCRRMLESADQN